MIVSVSVKLRRVVVGAMIAGVLILQGCAQNGNADSSRDGAGKPSIKGPTSAPAVKGPTTMPK